MTEETSKIKKPQVTIYTDGACKGNPGRGGWGAWLSSAGHEKEMFGGEKLTTTSVDLGGIYYTPCVLNVRRSPASLAGETIWPGKLDEAKLAASKAFNAEFKRQMKGHV